MSDVPALLKRQAEWQKRRASLSWPEKMRLAERLRDDVATLRHGSTAGPSSMRPSSLTGRPCRDSE